MFIPVILGTAREGRASEAAAKFVLNELTAAGHETQLIDLRDYRFGETIPEWLPNKEKVAQTEGWRAIAARAQAFMIVSPEYNHGYPGELKMLLDSAYSEYAKKPVAICGVSSGGLGGARMVEQLRLVAIELVMFPTRGAVYFSNIGKLFNPDGTITDDTFKKRVADLITELTALVR